jgi:2-polyprenyl-6-hydroxyphenyl methylase/3-demethylubiquinone-9 3-methyltransferase
MSSGTGYYDKKLSAAKLKRVYEIAPPRVQQYLHAEIDHVLSLIKMSDKVLELGCGYGRVLSALAENSGRIWGIDTSMDSLKMAKESLSEYKNLHLAQMNAIRLGFKDDTFDLTICVQNGISAFKVDNRKSIEESVRVTKQGGLVLISTYLEKFWSDRIEWFEIQAKAGLLGKIDFDKSGDGEIVCDDGFRATTISPEVFKSLISDLNLNARLIEVDDSSLFCEIEV